MKLEKYNQPVPRYTSYPTVPMWEDNSFSEEGYKKTLNTAFWESAKEVSIYIHLPFCESLCTYCACNTRITKNHQVEAPYINHVLKEWKLYLEALPEKPVIREVHLGGGTPTFFSPQNLQLLINGIFEGADRSADLQMSFEGHPANTKETHLQALFEVGFDRLSLGIQDFDPTVQKLINRRQSFEQVKNVTDCARKIGYTSINYDVVYGLPGQNSTTLRSTLSQVVSLSPDRIAYYSYAHVPSLKPGQKSYEMHLPTDEEKLALMELGRRKWVEYGYEEVGMDHFVKPADELLKAREEGYLHRNFMGYTTYSSKLLVGLGVSAISDSWTGFAQNEKSVESYYARLEAGELPIVRGHLLNHEDLFFRKHILNLMCNFEAAWTHEEFMEYGLSINFQLLEELASDGYVSFNELGVSVLKEGRDLIRIICSALDARLNTRGKPIQFSKSI